MRSPSTGTGSRRHCVQLENCFYDYNEMLVLNMVRAGLFGELTHGGAAYNHDLRSILFSPEGEGQWRRYEHLTRDGNLYPTHGLGPVAHYMDVNRGDRFDHLVSRVVDVGEIDDRRHEIGIDDERLPIRCSRPLHVSLLAIVQAGAFNEVLCGERGLRIREGGRLVPDVPHH